MKMDVKRFILIKEKITKLQREKDRAEGALAKTMEEIETKFKVGSFLAAEGLLKKFKVESSKIKAKFEKAFADFEEKWSERLGE